MKLLKKFFEKKRARKIQRTREKYFDMFLENALRQPASHYGIGYGSLQDFMTSADEVVSWLYDIKSPCPSCAHTPQSSHCPG